MEGEVKGSVGMTRRHDVARGEEWRMVERTAWGRRT
jgi:hypothetical protein